MKMLNIVGWKRTPEQKAVMKAKRLERRHKREQGKYAREHQQLIESINRNITRKRNQARA